MGCKDGELPGHLQKTTLFMVFFTKKIQENSTKTTYSSLQFSLCFCMAMADLFDYFFTTVTLVTSLMSMYSSEPNSAHRIILSSIEQKIYSLILPFPVKDLNINTVWQNWLVWYPLQRLPKFFNDMVIYWFWIKLSRGWRFYEHGNNNKERRAHCNLGIGTV